MKKILVNFILFTLLSIHYKAFGSDKVVSVVSLVDYAPYVFIEGTKPIVGAISTQGSTELVGGYSWDVFKESFYIMGYSIEYTVVPWSRAIKYLTHGRAQLMFPVIKSDERMQTFDYSKESINKVDYVVYLPKTSSLKWNGYKSLNKKVIGFKRGYFYGEEWATLTNVTKYAIGNISNGFQMLKSGNIDGFIGYKDGWDYVLKQKDWIQKFKKTPIIDSTLEYVVSMKGIKKNSELLDVYDKGKRRLIENGRLDELKHKWFGSNKAK
jgi:polar amino acid transport system substrate-binding protein